jgi:hypothetical protein
VQDVEAASETAEKWDGKSEKQTFTKKAVYDTKVGLY